MKRPERPVHHFFALSTMHTSFRSLRPVAAFLAACAAPGLVLALPAVAQPAQPCASQQLGLTVDGTGFLLRHQACAPDQQLEADSPAVRRPLLSSPLLKSLLQSHRELGSQVPSPATTFRSEDANIACMAISPGCFTAAEWASYCESNPGVAFAQARSCADARQVLAARNASSSGWR
jgi:hypothetical protein